MGFLATAITMFFNPVDAILGSPELDWPETVFDALLASTQPPPLYLTRANPTLVPVGVFICLVVTSMVPSVYMISRLGPTSFSLAYSPFVATRLFIKHADPFTVCFATLLFGMSLGCTLDFLFAFNNTHHIVLRSAFDILSSALLSYIKPYCSMGIVTLLALFSIGLYLQQRKQTNPVKTNKGDVPSERIPASDGDASAVSNVEKTSPAATLPFPTNSKAISQRTNPDYEAAEASFLAFLLPYLQAVLIIGPVVLSSYTADVAQVFHDEIVDTGSLGEHAEKSIVPSCRRCLSGHYQATEHSEHIATNIDQSQDNHLVETSPTPSGSPSFLELTDSPSLVTGSDTAAATESPSVFLDLCV
ncbi:hypothetical protein ARMSODRAFT_1087178 [Armillaria solidipes]|uniref:Uncharacterized protein n=1 Tax=Armillaria solidipes TaxID=1076256 RepID=A0A2H3BAL7_9AGAR|nr:hypothetical protein ARMSODRAFT_1087178 [Armillaria solidipes]